MIIFRIGDRHYSVLGDTGRLSMEDVILLQTRGKQTHDKRCLVCKKANAKKTSGTCLSCIQTEDLDYFSYDDECGVPFHY